MYGCRQCNYDVCASCSDRSSSSASSASSSSDRRTRLREGGHTTLYHQTSSDVAASIISDQKMLRGSGGMAGGGIYFAVSQSDTHHKAQSKGVILQVQVQLGRIKTISSNGDSSVSFQSLQAEGYDSVMIPRSGGTEYVVYNQDQASSIRRA